jgi:Rv2525c-like, glycoside hydrolase-like domain
LKIGKLAPIFAALILAACHRQPSPTLSLAPDPTPGPRSGIGPAEGIDLPTDSSDALNELKDSGIAFVARYYRDPTSRWPPLSAAEAQRLSSLGLKIVAIWEPYSPDPPYFSYYSGYHDATAAYSQAKAVGQPAGSAIYFAIDFNPQALHPIYDYFRGVAAGLAAAGGGKSEYKVGVYGSGAVCEAMKEAGLAQFTWLSNSRAWTGSLAYQGWNIRQGGRWVGLSLNHDADEARDDYGGFRIANDATAAPVAAAASPQAPAPQAPIEGQWFANLRLHLP